MKAKEPVSAIDGEKASSCRPTTPGQVLNPGVVTNEGEQTMKKLGIVIATLAIMTSLSPPLVGAHAVDERPSAQACLWHPSSGIPLGVVCATGTIGHVGPYDCDPVQNGCYVMKTAHLRVDPVACGWLRLGDLSACATEKPEFEDHQDAQFYAAGSYRVESEVCISDPTVTATVQCEMLVHHFVVPPQTSDSVGTTVGETLAPILETVSGLLDPVEEKLVYASGTFAVYQLSAY